VGYSPRDVVFGHSVDRPNTIEGASTNRLDIQVLTDIESISGLRDEWEALRLRSLEPTPFAGPGWQLAWWEAFSERDWMPRLVTARNHGRLSGLVPLVIVQDIRMGSRCAVLRLWENPISNRSHFLLDEDDIQQGSAALVEAILHHPMLTWNIADLQSLSLDGRATSAVVEALARRQVPYGVDQGHDSPFRDLPDDWPTLFSGLSKSFRKTLRRVESRASREGLTVRHSSRLSGLSPALEVSRTTWQYAAGTAIVSSPATQRFYENMVRGAEGSGTLRISTLWKEETPIAFEINLFDAGVAYNLKGGFDPAYSGLSPGLVLRQRVLQDAIESGIVQFDFLGTADRHKLHWTSTTRRHGSLFVVRAGFRWRLYHLIRYSAKSVLERRAPWVLTAKRRLQALVRH
jgi:CelD/BcsL family acetyltransferase involved in cellulose biosynthesis